VAVAAIAHQFFSAFLMRFSPVTTPLYFFTRNVHELVGIYAGSIVVALVATNSFGGV